MRKKRLTIGTALMLILLAVTATFNITFVMAAEYFNQRLGDVEALQSKYQKLDEIMAIVDKYFVGDYDAAAAMDGAALGYVYGLGDEWSSYYTAEQTAQLMQSNENTYVGIGITISFAEADMYTVLSVTDGGPAQQAGVQVMDVLTAVDGVSVTDFPTTDDVVNAVKGEEGTTVKITVVRQGQLLDFEVQRAAVFNEMVTTRMLDGKIGYVAIDQFEKNIDVEFNTKVDELLSDGAEALIFDVRFNPGGYLTVMVNMLDKLLPEGTVISITDKAGKVTEYRSVAEHLDVPMAVITNEYSVSAAEFFAASLQEYGVAEIVGTKTNGKGFAQNLFPLSDGSSVNLSTDRYYTPKGVSLAGVGVTPDHEVELTQEQLINFAQLTDEQDPQLQKAIEVIRKQLPQEPVEQPDANGGTADGETTDGENNPGTTPAQ